MALQNQVRCILLDRFKWRSKQGVRSDGDNGSLSVIEGISPNVGASSLWVVQS
jgi:hypothetical protein